MRVPTPVSLVFASLLAGCSPTSNYNPSQYGYKHFQFQLSSGRTIECSPEPSRITRSEFDSLSERHYGDRVIIGHGSNIRGKYKGAGIERLIADFAMRVYVREYEDGTNTFFVGCYGQDHEIGRWAFKYPDRVNGHNRAL
jgi:hypothetical protein